MSTATVELTNKHGEAIAAADRIIAAAECGKRPLTPSESRIVDGHIQQANRLKAQLETTRTNASTNQVAQVRAMLDQFPITRARVTPPNSGELLAPKKFSAEYHAAFMDYASSRGTKIGAALYEGSSPAGGYAVPITVDDQIVPLAPADMAVRQLATVISTKNDRLIPTKSTFGSTATKTETNAFGGTVPTLNQFTLSAFMLGTFAQCSFEIIQDVPEFENFVLDDISLDIQELEEPWFISGTGSGQAQGMIGNVGTGVTEEPDTNGNLVSINGTLDLVGSLRAVYYPNATFLMSRATGIGIRKAQLQTNAYEHVWTRVGNQDYLHGFPVAFSEAMPTAARGATPVLFGDFKRGYLIGDRGGSAVRLKVVDQGSLAVQGLVGLVAWRRTDGRVRRSEAIQQYNVAAS